MTSILDAINLNGAPVLLTGAMGSIGQNITKLLVELRAEIILIDKVVDKEFIENISALSEFPVTFFACDLEDRENREKAIQKIKEHTSSLFSLINNAAFVGKSNLEGWNVPFSDQSLDTWQRVLEVNLQAPFHLSQGLYPLLKNRNGANIINMGSIYGVVGPDWRLYEKTAMANPFILCGVKRWVDPTYKMVGHHFSAPGSGKCAMPWRCFSKSTRAIC